MELGAGKKQRMRDDRKGSTSTVECTEGRSWDGGDDHNRKGYQNCSAAELGMIGAFQIF